MSEKEGARVFISFASQEKDLAGAIKSYIERAFTAASEAPNVKVFVSDNSITAGELWENEIKEEIKNANLVLVLCSKLSVMRPWVNFERGAGSMGRNTKVIGLCHSGLRASDLKQLWEGWRGRVFDLHEAECGIKILRTVHECMPNSGGVPAATDWAGAIQGYFNPSVVPPQKPGEPFMLFLEWKRSTAEEPMRLHITQPTPPVNSTPQNEEIERRKGIEQIASMTKFLADRKRSASAYHSITAGVAIGIQNCLYDGAHVYVGVRMKGSRDYSASHMEISRGHFNTGYNLLRSESDATRIFREEKSRNTAVLPSIEDLQDLFVTMPGIRKQILRPNIKMAGTENEQIYTILNKRMWAAGAELWPVLFDDGQEGVATVFINNSMEFPRFEIGVWKYIVIDQNISARLKKDRMIAGFGHDAFLDYRGAVGIDDFALNYWIWVRDGRIFYWSFPEERLIDRHKPATPWGDRKHEILVTEQFMVERYGNRAPYTPFVSDECLSLERQVLKESFSLPARTLLTCF